MAKHIFICNTVFLSETSGKAQAVAVRERGDANGKTIKLNPAAFGNVLPLPGDAIYAEADLSSATESGNYRVLRNCKIHSVGVAPGAAMAEHAEEGPLVGDGITPEVVTGAEIPF